MLKPAILALIRQLLTVAGTALVAKGYVQACDIEPVIGAQLTIGSAMWSVVDKRRYVDLRDQARARRWKTGRAFTPREAPDASTARSNPARFAGLHFQGAAGFCCGGIVPQTIAKCCENPRAFEVRQQVARQLPNQ